MLKVTAKKTKYLAEDAKLFAGFAVKKVAKPLIVSSAVLQVVNQKLAGYYNMIKQVGH